MDADEEAEKSVSGDIPATMEEMRQRRLAYFSATDSRKTLNEWEIENPLSALPKTAGKESQQAHPQSSDIQTSHQEFKNRNTNHFSSQRDQSPVAPSYSATADDSSSVITDYFNFNITNKVESPKQSDLEPQHSERKLNFINKDPKPLRPRKGKFVHKSMDSDASHLQLTESQDNDGLSVFNSQPDLEDLGLSTHRPESETSDRLIEGEIFIPTNHGSAKTTKQIFSDRVEEEIRSALGDEKMEQLMLKVNADIGQLHQHSRSPRRRQRLEQSKISVPEQNGTGLSRSSSVDSFSPMISSDLPVGDYRSRAGSQSPRRRQPSINLQDSEKEVHTLVRNYDQITIPKNTKNSFSSEEIYRKAYGGFQEASSNPERLTMRRLPNFNPSDFSPQGESRLHQLSNRGRTSSIDSSNSLSTSSSHFQNYPGMFAPPVSSMPSTTFDPQLHNSVPHSPQNSFRGQAGSGPLYMQPAYPHHHSVYPESPGSIPPQFSPFTSQSPSYSPSAMSSSNPFFYSPSPFSSPFGMPRFPENFPYHLPPPQHFPHQTVKHGQGQAPFEQMARRNSITLHGHPGYRDESTENLTMSPHFKVPHPPTNPPALSRYDESGSKSRPGVEGKQSSTHLEQTNGKMDEKDFNSFNLQRYFSSIDLSPEDIDPAVISSSLPSSRSVDGDFYKSSNDDMSTFTNTSDFTSVTKAGGVTNRLKDLGVNLDHLKHLRVVDNKGDADTKTEDLSKMIRRCPECRTANKTYMMICIECSESLIGVEPSMPRGKKKLQKTASNEKISSKSIQDLGKRRSVDQDGKLQPTTGDSDFEDGGNYLRKDSPESGKGISLSSSPVRYRRDQEECVEPKDSGRASIGDMREGSSQLAPECEELVDSYHELNNNVEIEYEDVEADIYEQISDPILRDFIISYRNRQELNLDPILNSCSTDDNYRSEDVNRKSGGLQYSSKYLTNTGTEHQKIYSADEITQSSQDNGEYKQSSMTDIDRKKTDLSLQGSDPPRHESYSESPQEKSQPSTDFSRPKKSKKKKKHRSDAIDIEIFGYEETRQSRNSSRCENIVPTLNLVRSSEEEESSEEDSDEDDNDDYSSSKLPEDGESIFTEVTPHPTLETGISHSGVSKSRQGLPSREIKKPSKSTIPQAVKSYSSPNSNLQRTFNERENGRPGSQTKPKGSNPVPPNYQRHWARSSIAWNSYKPRELSTRSSIPASPQQHFPKGSRPSSARLPQRRANNSEASNVHSSTNTQARQRPASAEYSRRKPVSSLGQQVRPNSAASSVNQSVVSSGTKSPSNPVSSITPVPAYIQRSEHIPENSNNATVNSQATSERVNVQETSKDNESPRLLCSELHRLPQLEENEPSDKMHAIAKTAYDRFHELTPRIQDSGLSLWQCLPDEIWLYVLCFLSQADLARLMTVSKGFHRLANDVSLWCYITVRPRYSVTDEALGSIASHQPTSLAMVKCQGPHLSHEALDAFFRDTQEQLKELNICGCSQGSLVGSVVLEAASKYCHNLTHVDVSFCNIKDNSFLALVNTVTRLESLCVNGFQSMSDSALLTLLKKHGKSLHTLELYACFSLTASVLRKLGDYCVKLRRLCLGGCNKLTDSTMITLSTCLPKIEELDLRGCKNLRNDCIRKIVRNCPRISTLVLANCQQISDAALVEMGTYLKDTLRLVDVCGCNLVGDHGIISLAKNCDQLASLDISSTKCTSSSLNHLASSGCSRWLKTIKLSFLTGLSEASMLNLIRQCIRLRLIHIFGCPSLKNLRKLRAVNPKVCIEGDVEMPRLSFQ